MILVLVNENLLQKAVAKAFRVARASPHSVAYTLKFGCCHASERSLAAVFVELSNLSVKVVFLVQY